MARRLIMLRAAVVLVCALIVGRLFQLQVVEGARNLQLADENRIRVVRRVAPRGNVYDRKNRLLAGSRLCCSVCVVPNDLRVAGAEDPCRGLAELLEIPVERVREHLDFTGPGRYDAAIVYRDAPDEVVARLEEHAVYLSGVSVLADAVRQYREGTLGAHALGYVREISADEFERLAGAGYRPLDRIGKAGIEKVAERALRGVDGGDQIEVDARGRRVRTLGTVSPRPGRNVWLTLDLELQRAAEEALGGRAGAVVALDPNTGEVLALASHPTFDPNVFVGALTSSDWKRLTSPGHPQHNRATTSQYPPGSVFKLVTAAAALEAGQCKRESLFTCKGAYRIGRWALRCWKRSGHGTLDFTEGFAQSCNVMFATLGRRVGPEALARMGRRFGLGSATGIDLPEEAAGLVPTPDWKRRKRNLPWYPGDTCQMAVGQGDVLLTPIQAAREVAVIANGGHLVTPHLIARIEAEPSPRRPADPEPVGLDAATIAAIRDGMDAVVAPGGTAARIANDYYSIAGKTGTAEASGGEPHAWFAGYAPVNGPQVVVAVIIEHAGHGSTMAAPVARHVLDTALLPPSKRRPWVPPGEETAPESLPGGPSQAVAARERPGRAQRGGAPPELPESPPGAFLR